MELLGTTQHNILGEGREQVECEGKQINGEDWVGRQAQKQDNYKCALQQRQCHHMVLKEHG